MNETTTLLTCGGGLMGVMAWISDISLREREARHRIDEHTVAWTR